MAKAYIINIEYSFSKRKNIKSKDISRVSDGSYYGSYKDAQIKAEKLITEFKNCEFHNYTILKYNIDEVEIPDSINIIGTVIEDGYYEDYDVFIGNDIFEYDQSVRKLLSEYNGQKIKLSVEVIKD